MYQGISSQGILFLFMTCHSLSACALFVLNLSALNISISALTPSLPQLPSSLKVSRLKVLSLRVSHIKVSHIMVFCLIVSHFKVSCLKVSRLEVFRLKVSCLKKSYLKVSCLKVSCLNSSYFKVSHDRVSWLNIYRLKFILCKTRDALPSG